jgi:hypothetical protein
MKATLIVIGNESDHAEAKSLVERLMTIRGTQAGLRLRPSYRGYQRRKWPRRAPSIADVLA